MSERAQLVVVQPCVLCEGPLEVWTYFKDDEREGQERIEKITMSHRCDAMTALLRERYETRPLPRARLDEFDRR